MASTQVVAITVGQIKRVHFPTENNEDQSVEVSIPHFVSPRKMIKPTNNQHRKRSSSLSFENKHHPLPHHFNKRRRKDEFVRPTKFLLVSTILLKLFHCP